MYRLDLADRGLDVPVLEYSVPSGRDAVRLVASTGLTEPGGTGQRRVAFFAPDREGIANLPVYEHYDPQGGQTLRVGTGDRSADGTDARPLFYILPADHQESGAATVRL